jgi:uncharacterized protein YjbJ (UPF0337 family)
VVRWPHCKKLQSRLPGRFYRRVARRELDDDVCRDLARHIKGFADQGIADSNMLTVHGLRGAAPQAQAPMSAGNRAQWNVTSIRWLHLLIPTWRNRVEGNWKQVKGKVKAQWGKLTDDDLDVIDGKQDQLEGRLQQRYGYAKDQAKKEVNAWFDGQKW